MTEDRRDEPDDDADDRHVERYEQLRDRAMAGDGPGWQLGLALLQRRGLVAWARAWPQHTEQPAVRRPVVAVPAAAGEQLVFALANMALARVAA